MTARRWLRRHATAPAILTVLTCVAVFAVAAPRPLELSVCVTALVLVAAFGIAALVATRRLGRDRELLLEALARGRTVDVGAMASDEGRRAADAVNLNVRRVLTEGGADGTTADEVDDDVHFLASLSHTLRTPLNAILGFSDVLESGGDGELDAEIAESVSVIRTSAEQLAIVIDEILDLCAIESGTLRLDEGAFEIGQLASDAVRRSRSAVDVATFEVRGEIETTASGDVGRVMRILTLVLRDVARTAQHADVTWGRTAGGRAYVQVEDDGPAFEPHDLGPLFDPYDPRRKRPARLGFGLGPGLARTLLRAQSGDMTIENRDGDAGIRVRLELPLATPHEAAS